jgi:hypothetical protein
MKVAVAVWVARWLAGEVAAHVGRRRSVVE